MIGSLLICLLFYTFAIIRGKLFSDTEYKFVSLIQRSKEYIIVYPKLILKCKKINNYWITMLTNH